MSYIIQCPCGQQMTVGAELSGQEAICPQCRQRLIVPPDSGDPASIPVASPAAQPAPLPLSAGMAPHRGGLILAFGIVAIVTQCLAPIFGTMAWVMGNSDLAQMKSGRMDPSGEGLTSAGRIIGIVSVCIFLALLAVYAVVFGVAAVSAFSHWPS